MIFIYLKVLVFYFVVYLIYAKTKNKLPEGFVESIEKNKYLVLFVAVMIPVFFIGSPYRLESTEISGKSNFSAELSVVESKTEADKEPETQDLEGQLKELKKKSKEIENENN